MSYLHALTRARNWKFAAIGAVFLIGFALTLTSAEASGDPYGDSTTDDGGIDGSAAAATGPVDGAYVQVGTEGSGGGSLTVAFTNNVAFDGAGADIRVHAVADGDPASATIAVSADGVTFVDAGTFADTADADIDLGTLGLDFATAVRITYDSGAYPGYNLDAVETLHGVGENTIVEASPDTAENPGFTDHTVTAHVSDETIALAGVPVSFVVAAGGPNEAEGTIAATDVSGDAEFTYTGTGGPGVDTITAWLDYNGNGAPDAGEPSDVVTKEWHGVTGTITVEDVDGGGLVSGDLVLVTVDDRDLDTTPGPDSVDVLVTSTTDPVGFMLTLHETGNSTGVFTGLVEIGDATDAGNQVLAAVAGDEVTAAYDDALDGEGNDPAPVTASISVVETEERTAGDKVTVCHMPPGNPGNAKTLEVGGEAYKAHLEHGDTVGECNEDLLPPTKQESQLDAFCERNPDHRRCEDGEVGSASQHSKQAKPNDSDDEEAED